MEKRIFCLFLLLIATQGLMAQLTSLGHVEETMSTGIYELSIHENQLYAASQQGLYQYNLDGTTGKWEKLPFTDDAITDFSVCGDTLIAINPKTLFFSTDGGETAKSMSIDVIAPGWRDNPYYNGGASLGEIKLSGLAVHPHNAQKFFVAYRGLSYTEDGGDSWTVVDIPDNSNILFEGVYSNPLDADNMIAYTNEGMTANSMAKVFVSADGGANWEYTKGYVGNSITKFYNLAFHPTDKNRIMMCGAGIYAKSEDQGKSWKTIGKESVNPDEGITPLLYLEDMVYDSRNSDIIYGADMTSSYDPDKKVHILRSTDGGLSWNAFFTIGGTHVVSCLSMSGNILAISTTSGIYLLDVDAVDNSVVPVVNDKGDTPYYDLLGRPVANPTRGIYIKDEKKIAVD